MTEFDAEKFEDKYVHYFNELQRAYKNAFERMNETYDSELIHAIDQQILNESEPFYEGDGEFRIDLPDDPAERTRGVVVDEEKLTRVLDIYVDELESEIREEFGFE
jgi:hypothetical protein